MSKRVHFLEKKVFWNEPFYSLENFYFIMNLPEKSYKQDFYCNLENVLKSLINKNTTPVIHVWGTTKNSIFWQNMKPFNRSAEMIKNVLKER